MIESHPGLIAALKALTEADKQAIGKIARAVYDDEELVKTLSEPINYSLMQIEEAYPSLVGIVFGEDDDGDATDYTTFLMIASMDPTYQFYNLQIRIPL